ncbi:MAG TPA: high-affinity branched-chain amino acid ABC transporter ATP-binding protein LivG [Syntrophobacteraceae bacterium]|nr:high-affinity branched-chain amino acid ABC transporter ATP-binding protein LivG [Syntrophobacteraceae bacterium]
MLLQIEAITRDFGGVRALDRVSLEVEAGTIHGLIGPNGAGKTTLLNIVSGIIRPTSGTIRFDHRPTQSLPPHRVAALGMGRTFQNIRLFPAMTCLENVMAGQHLVARRRLLPRLFCLPSVRREEHALRNQALSCLARVGLEQRAALPSVKLPYGERRRLEIARALASGPRLLLLDEPVAGMHHSGLQQVAGLIRSLADEGMTILLIEHNMAFVMSLCSRITVLNFGRVIATGTPGEVAQHPEVIAAYLGIGHGHA